MRIVNEFIKIEISKGKYLFNFYFCKVDGPEKWINDMASSGADQFTFHLESTETPEDCIRRIKESGMKVGIAIKPNTNVQLLVPFIKGTKS